MHYTTNNLSKKTYKGVAVVGLQWGDEGKGKITDLLTNESDIIIRSSGGCNAGHTIMFNGEKHSVRQLPSGIYHKDKINVIADGCVIDPKVLMSEYNAVKSIVDFTPELLISGSANIILNIHKVLDKNIEDIRANKVGTTKNGIGPCYADKVLRIGLRIGELMYEHMQQTDIYRIVKDIYDVHGLGTHIEEIDDELDMLMELKDYIKQNNIKVSLPGKEFGVSLEETYKQLKTQILFEGAQGSMLDINDGDFPYVTSSNTLAPAISLNCSMTPKCVTDVIGVVKAYSTRVGNGPFVTEIENQDITNYIRHIGHEYGTVTGRPRRIGWLNLIELKQMVKLNGVTKIALMLLDVLSGLDEISVLVDSETDNEFSRQFYGLLNNIPVSTTHNVKYMKFNGWEEDISKCKLFDDLPENAKTYIRYIEHYLAVPISYISVGPDREQTIIIEDE